ncbi:hypothetical protein RI054_02g13330 [Pseudoscourfieldia marina]
MEAAEVFSQLSAAALTAARNEAKDLAKRLVAAEASKQRLDAAEANADKYAPPPSSAPLATQLAATEGAAAAARGALAKLGVRPSISEAPSSGMTSPYAPVRSRGSVGGIARVLSSRASTPPPPNAGAALISPYTSVPGARA